MGGDMMTEELFIKNVAQQIRCVKAREGIERELSDHIADQTAAYEETKRNTRGGGQKSGAGDG